MCDLFWEGGGRIPIDGELLPYGILSGGRKSMGGSHVTPDSPYYGNMMYPQQKLQFHTIIINHYVSRNMSTCVVTSQLAHNQRLQVSG